MLKTRVIAALIAAPLVILMLFFTSEAVFTLSFLMLASIALYEWGNLAGLHSLAQKTVYIGVYWFAAYWMIETMYMLYGLIGVSLFWVWALIMVFIYPAGNHWLSVRLVHLAVGLLLMLGAWMGLVLLKRLPEGEWLLLWTMILVWGADVGAYFSGKTFGTHKLAPAISPGKTREGAVGGVLVAVAATLALVFIVPAYKTFQLPLWLWAGLAVSLAVLSVAGDLFESIVKRSAGVKDSGSIFPGHGGLLDRIDALIAVIPVFSCIMYGFYNMHI
ncbi:MAG: phosphatidate cytidylyltransferase [Pseudomonadales bacterium]|nr:phosphatidate cytidylyltransferase [Pseudomonadales bacterium]